ncbi:MAG: hypothetical protein H8E18_16725 [FCB group bacterium]|nr:hypothetical protein [FCB group bacterium]
MKGRLPRLPEHNQLLPVEKNHQDLDALLELDMTEHMELQVLVNLNMNYTLSVGETSNSLVWEGAFLG